MRIAIIGAGITGLRAGLELCRNHDVTLFEKSAGVGGRVSTRRSDDISINHGAPRFDRFETLFEADPPSIKYRQHFTFDPAATALPKAMRNDLLELGAKLMLNAEVTSVNDGKLLMADKNIIKFEAVLITCPIPQARKLLGGEILPRVDYTKEIRLIGVRDKKPWIEELPQKLVEEVFELTEEEIRSRCNIPSDLMVKKWRFARVKTGMPTLFCKITDRMLVAGDAFDPRGHYDLSSAWVSGLSSGMFLN